MPWSLHKRVVCSIHRVKLLFNDNRQTLATQKQSQTTAANLRCLSVPQPEAASFIKDGSHVFRGPVFTAEDNLAGGSNNQENSSKTMHTTRMRPVARP